MENQEKLAQMRSSIDQLKQLTEMIDEETIYPVSFFSRAFDLTGEIRKQLHEIEQEQVETLDQQLKPHHAQMEVTTQQERVAPLPKTEKTELSKPFVPEEIAAQVSAIAPVKRTSAPAPSPPIKNVQPLPEIKEKKSLSQTKEQPVDLRRLMTIHEHFRFAREFFHHDEQLMNNTLDHLNGLSSIEESIDYMKKQVEWNEEEECVRDFILFLEKRYR